MEEEEAGDAVEGEEADPVVEGVVEDLPEPINDYGTGNHIALHDLQIEVNTWLLGLG